MLVNFIFHKILGEQWMQVTTAPPSGCPPGLEYLTQIDQLLVKQQVELLEGTQKFLKISEYPVLILVISIKHNFD